MSIEHTKKSILDHEGETLNYQITTSGNDSLEEWIRNVRAFPLNKEAAGPHVQSIKPNFSLQLFVGEPGNGQVFFCNFNHLNKWLRAVERARREAGNSDRPELQDISVIESIAEVIVEENIHSVSVEQSPHRPEALGLCRHRHKLWTKAQPLTHVTTCECALQEYIGSLDDATE